MPICILRVENLLVEIVTVLCRTSMQTAGWRDAVRHRHKHKQKGRNGSTGLCETIMSFQSTKDIHTVHIYSPKGKKKNSSNISKLSAHLWSILLPKKEENCAMKRSGATSP